MFDKLIESNSVAAEFKPRRKFFMLSSVVVGVLFLSALVISLYAQKLDLGTDNFELVELLAPIEPDAPEPEQPRQQPQQAQNQSEKTEPPSRQVVQERVDQAQIVPTEISTTPNRYMSIPEGVFQLNPNGPDSNGSGPTGVKSEVVGSSSGPEVVESTPVKVVEPPPIAKVEPKKPTIVTKKVLNGSAISLPKPPYPPIAKAVRLTGDVNVQVVIDERGNVISAKAVSGHVFFKAEAERAARLAKFGPTLLGDDPVKVTGIITYRFSM